MPRQLARARLCSTLQGVGSPSIHCGALSRRAPCTPSLHDSGKGGKHRLLHPRVTFQAVLPYKPTREGQGPHQVECPLGPGVLASQPHTTRAPEPSIALSKAPNVNPGAYQHSQYNAEACGKSSCQETAEAAAEAPGRSQDLSSSNRTHARKAECACQIQPRRPLLSPAARKSQML